MFPDRSRDRSAGMFPVNSARMFPDDSVASFLGNSAAVFLASSAKMFLENSAQMYLGMSVSVFLDRYVLMFHVGSASRFQDDSALLLMVPTMGKQNSNFSIISSLRLHFVHIVS